MKPHKHAELIKAWADGAEIEERYKYKDKKFQDFYEWEAFEGNWSRSKYYEYRIKPESKPDVVRLYKVFDDGIARVLTGTDLANNAVPNLKLTFDGETGEPKSAEVLK